MLLNNMKTLDLTEILACPLCGSPLTRLDGRLLCASGHSYDVAGSGYVNLLPPGRGKNAGTGDDADMVRARREFLALGCYDKISDGIADAILKYAGQNKLAVVDAGCGEGHHTCRITAKLRDGGRDVICAAFDASKRAVASGEKLALRMGLAPSGGVGIPVDSFGNGALVGFMTGNIFHMPVKSASCGAVLSMFAPIPWDECGRVLIPGGIIVVAASGKNHLIELRRVIYDDVRVKSPSPESTYPFELAGRERLEYKFSLERSEDIMNLYSMTPFKYRTSPESERRIAALTRIDLTAEVEYFIYRRITNLQ